MPSVVARHPLLCVLLCALALRVMAAFGLQWYLDHKLGRDFLISGDAEGYWELGVKIAHGEEFSLHQPPRRVMRMPGFPALLAVSVRLFGESYFAARLLLAVVGTVACGFVYWLGTILFNSRVGIWGAILAAISPAYSLFSVLILSETAFAATLVLSLIAMAGLVRDVQGNASNIKLGWLALLVGVTVAIACYMRPSWLLAAPLFAGVLFLFECKSKRPLRGLVLAVVIGAGLIVTLAPWTIRNYRVTGGHIVQTTLWMGPSLYDGLHPGATGESDMAFFDREALTRTMSEYEVDRHYRRVAWDFVKENPGRALELTFIKLGRYWKPWPNAEQFGGTIPALAVGGFFVPLVLLAICGFWFYRDRFWACALTAGPIVYFALVHMVFIGSLRYRLPAEYPLCVLSAAGLDFWITRRGTNGAR